MKKSYSISWIVDILLLLGLKSRPTQRYHLCGIGNSSRIQVSSSGAWIPDGLRIRLVS